MNREQEEFIKRFHEVTKANLSKINNEIASFDKRLNALEKKFIELDKQADKDLSSTQRSMKILEKDVKSLREYSRNLSDSIMARVRTLINKK